jgi:L-fuculose-phosphate aldolase
VSGRDGDLVAVSPSGVDYAELTADLVGVHRLDGTPVEAVLRPASELPLHLGVYAATGAAAIVHTHSVAATTLSTVAVCQPGARPRNPRLLPAEEIALVASKLAGYGQRAPKPV